MEIPEGWKLVPVELTEEMNVAGIYACVEFDDRNIASFSETKTEKVERLNARRKAIYRAQIAAAPTWPYFRC